MPDDEIIESQEPETETDEDLEAAFLEEASEDSEKIDQKPEETDEPKEQPDKDKSEKETPAESESDKSDTKSTDETKEEGAEKEGEPAKTARERVEERLKDVEEEEGDKEEVEKHRDETVEKETKTRREPGGRLTKENIKVYLDHISDDELPDTEIIVGDKTINFKELREEEPEIYEAMKVMSSYAFEKGIRVLAEKGALVTGKQQEETQKALDEANKRIEDLEFWNEVYEIHADYRKVVKSKDFGDWLGEQGTKIQRMSKNLSEPQEAIDLIDMYKEDIAKKAAKEHDEKLAAKKKRTDDIHKHTMRQSKQATKTDDDTVNTDDEFRKEAEELDKKERA